MANGNSELKLFETLENFTNNDSFCSKASFVQNFLKRDLDLNNTQQSILEEDEEGSSNENSGGSCGNSVCSVESESGNTQFDKDDAVKFAGKSRAALLSFLLRKHCRKEKIVQGNESKGNSVKNHWNNTEKVGKRLFEDDDKSYHHDGELVGEISILSKDFDEAEDIEEKDDGNEEDETEDSEDDETEGDDNARKNMLSQLASDDEDIRESHDVVDGTANWSTYFELLELKKTLESKEIQLTKEKETFKTLKSTEENRMKAERKRVEFQRKSLQNLMTDYNKVKFSKEEYEEKIKGLSDQLKETKLQMNKRFTRWNDQQKRLEERVKVLEKENEELKKEKDQKKSLPARLAALKRPPMRCLSNNKNKPTIKGQPRRVQFVDDYSRADEGLEDKENGSSKNTEDDFSSSINISSEEDFPTNSGEKHDSVSDLSQQFYQGTKEVNLSDVDADKTMPSDYTEITHSCGTVTRVTKDQKLIRHVLINKDVMDEHEDCSVRYYYQKLGFSQTTYPNGDEIIEYDSGEIETRRADGSKIYTYSDGLVKMVDGASGSEEVIFGDGSIIKNSSNGECTVIWPSGQKEIRTPDYVKRIYTNGTVKIMYKDGSEETRYFNGRVRRKDKNGVLVDDTKKHNTKDHKKSV